MATPSLMMIQSFVRRSYDRSACAYRGDSVGQERGYFAHNFLSPLLGERLAFACGGEREELLRHIHGRNGEAATSGSIGQWSVSR